VRDMIVALVQSRQSRDVANRGRNGTGELIGVQIPIDVSIS